MSADPKAAPGSVEELLNKIRDPDDTICGPAWQSADAYGAAAVAPLAALLADADFELVRRAERALYKIVRRSTGPGAKRQAQAVEAALIPFLQSPSAVTRRSVAWMLSEVGGDRAAKALAPLLADSEAAEDARCALTRLPAKKATALLKKAFLTASPDFRYALADSLRQRGEKLADYPTRKRIPTKSTAVVPVKTGPKGN